jgi:hypothetical protein
MDDLLISQLQQQRILIDDAMVIINKIKVNFSALNKPERCIKYCHSTVIARFDRTI